ncbi:hypothetical protein B0H11DRAFT_324527 [Mycena galericulata]|nr:hypothetical protein B0H11DRAFT_324527 [Mycena galericulata]
MSAEELQALIEKLGVDIDRQKEVLTQLERRKIAAHRQLNGIRDPVARLPLEIASEIFSQCIPSRAMTGADHVPMLFLNVCNAWANIALSTPGLWARIHLDDEKCSDLPNLLETWLQRAGNRAFSITLRGVFNSASMTALKRHTHQIQELEAQFENDELRILFMDGEFPILKSLRISGDYDAREAMDVLRVLPDLVECTLDNLTPDSLDHEELLLHHMQHFKLGGSEEVVLKRITLPDLKNLSLLVPSIEASDLLGFLKRSLPPLRKLSVGTHDWRMQWGLDEMEESFSLIPTLTHLELSYLRPTTALLVVTALSNSPHLLPNLSSLTFRRLIPHVRWFGELLRALSARRTKIASVTIMVETEFDVDDTPDVIAGLRQLIADGMKIHIGTEQQNFI